jgi:hypothetical protein
VEGCKPNFSLLDDKAVTVQVRVLKRPTLSA